MNITRVDQIKASLAGYGTTPEKGYSNKEIISRLIELENALLAGVYEKNHAENMRPQDLTKHFAALAEEFGLDESSTYKRFVKNMDELDFAVKTFIGGQRGEQLARGSLRPLTFDQSVKILYNIALENGEMKTEYDAIVIAPFGLFVVEVKNWNGDVMLTKDGFLTRSNGAVCTNLAARMLVKEALLRECLADLWPETYHGILLFPENKTRLRDEYHRLPVGYGAGIANSIRACSSSRARIPHEQIEAIADRITSHHAEQLTYCTVKCNEIIEDFAMLMAQMESASNEESRQDAEDTVEITVSANIDVSPDVTDALDRGREALRGVAWKRVGKIGIGIAAALIAGVAAGRAWKLNARNGRFAG